MTVRNYLIFKSLQIKFNTSSFFQSLHIENVSGSSLVQISNSFKHSTHFHSLFFFYISFANYWPNKFILNFHLIEIKLMFNNCESHKHNVVCYALFYFLNSNVVQQMRSCISKYHMCTTHITDLSQWKCLAKKQVFFNVCFILGLIIE